MTKLQLTLIMAWYYFDKSNNVNMFTRRFNQYFDTDYSAQTILFSAAKFKNVNPANNIRQANTDEKYVLLWKKYISGNQTQELKDLYREFRKGAFIARPSVSEESIISIPKAVKEHIDTPILKLETTELSVSGYPRNVIVAANALHNANYECELKCSTKLFLRKNAKVNYTEAHHLIPLCYQNDFDYSLDVEANVVSLCPNCHRRLHYGDDISDVLKLLYLARKDRLAKCGINVSFAQLLLLYR